mgnify:CR=1 FL=1
MILFLLVHLIPVISSFWFCALADLYFLKYRFPGQRNLLVAALCLFENQLSISVLIYLWNLIHPTELFVFVDGNTALPWLLYLYSKSWSQIMSVLQFLKNLFLFGWVFAAALRIFHPSCGMRGLLFVAGGIFFFFKFWHADSFDTNSLDGHKNF